LSGEIPPYDTDISENESNESRFWVVSFRMETGSVVPHEEEERGVSMLRWGRVKHED
jgi:hypothetical protein